MKDFGEKQRFETTKWGYLELKLKMNGDSYELASKLQEHKNGLNGLGEMFQMAQPKIATNGEYLEIGICFPCPDDVLNKLNYDKLAPIVDQIKGVDQRVYLDLELGTSCQDILEGGDSLIAEANKGFKLQFNLDVLENFKKICYDVIKNPEAAGPLGSIAAAIAPFVLLQANAKIELTSDSFGEIKELSMMEPFLANFNQIFEGMAGSEVDATLEERCDLDAAPDLNPGIKMAMEFMHTLFDIFKEMHESGEVVLSASIPNIVSTRLNITSEKLGTACHLGSKFLVYDGKLKDRYEYALN